MTDRRVRYRNAFKCAKCPNSNGEDGCPAWWEYPNAQNQIVKACAFDQKVLMNFLLSAMHESHCAAASADKATNAAAESALASQSALKSSSTAAALMLGALMGEIKPVGPQLEDHSNGNGQVLPAPRAVD